MSRYRVVLRWESPLPAPNKSRVVSYVIDASVNDTLLDVIGAAKQIAPRTDPDQVSSHWVTSEIWRWVDLPSEEGRVDGRT